MSNDYDISLARIRVFLQRYFEEKWRLPSQSWGKSRLLFFLQCFALGGALSLFVKVLPVLSAKVPFLQNVAFLPEPLNTISTIILIVFTKYVLGLVAKIKTAVFFRMDLRLTLLVIFLEFLVISSFYIIARHKETIKDYLKRYLSYAD